MTITESVESEFNTNSVHSNSELKLDRRQNNDLSKKSSFTKNKRRVRFNSFNNSSSMSNPLYKKEERNSILFRNYFDDSFDRRETEDDEGISTEDTITLTSKPSTKNLSSNSNENSLSLNFSQDKILFNNIQYDSMFIHDIDPFKEKSDVSKKSSETYNFNILDELKKEEEEEKIKIQNKENKHKEDETEEKLEEIPKVHASYFDEKPPNYMNSSKKEKKSKKGSVTFDEEQLKNYKKNSKSNRSKKGKKDKKRNSNNNDTTRELLKNKFLKFVKKYASNSNNYSLSDDVEIEKSFYNFYDENFGKDGIKKEVDFDKNIGTYEKTDGSKFDVTINDLFDNQNEFDEFKNSIYIDHDESDDESTFSSGNNANSKKRNTSFQYNSSFVYDHNSFGPNYEDNLNYLCYNISTCIDEDYVMDDEEENKKKNENILSGLFDDEDDNNKTSNDNHVLANKGKSSEENSKLKENLKTFMESEAFKKVIKDPDTLTIFLKGILSDYVDPKKIDQTKDKLFKMIDNEEIEQIKKFVNDYVDIVEESEDKIKDMKEKSIMIEADKHNGEICTDVIESNPGFMARFNEIMIEKFTNINNAIINFTTGLCPQIIKNGLNSIMKSIPFVVSFASLIPMEYVTGLLSSFPAGQAILNVVNDVVMKSTFLATSHTVLPQIAILIGCLYKNFSNRGGNDSNSRGANDSSASLTKFMGIFEIFSKHLKNDGGLSNTEKDPSVITSKVINAAFKTMIESKDLPNVFHNEKMNTIMKNLVDNVPNSENKIKAGLAVLNEVMNKDNATCKALFDELINLLDREKLNDDDFNKILTLIIKGSQEFEKTSTENKNIKEIEGPASSSPSSHLLKGKEVTEEEGDEGYDPSVDKSYSVIMLSQVIDELKKSKSESIPKNDFLKSDIGIMRTYSLRDIHGAGEQIIHEYRMDDDDSKFDKKIKMKKAYDRRTYSLGGGSSPRNYNYERREYPSEFTIRKYDPTNYHAQAQFSIRRKKEGENSTVEHIIPKYYSTSSTSPAFFRRRYNSYDERTSYPPIDHDLIHQNTPSTTNSSSPLESNRKRHNTFQGITMKNEWNDEKPEDSKPKLQEKFTIKSNNINIGDSLIHDEAFTPFSTDNNTNLDKTEPNNDFSNILRSNSNRSSNSDGHNIYSNENITEDYSNGRSIAYSINSDDTYDRLFLKHDISTATLSEDSLNSTKGGIDNSKKSKTSFKQKVMRRFSRSGSKKELRTPKYIEWENLPLEIVFNIFKNFSVEELAKLREVSRYFNYILTNPIFFMNINLTNESDSATNKLLFYQWKLSNGYLLSLNLSQCNLINENIFKEVIDYPIQDRKINDKSENERVNLCFNDANAKFEKEESLVQNLRNLDLSYCNGIYSSKIMCNFFRGFSIQPNGTLIRKNGCLNLEELNLSDLYQILDDDLLISIADSCPKLKALYISKGYDITNYAIKTLLRKCPRLETLKLANCPKINYEAFDTRRIEEISITSKDVGYDLNLKYLNVSYCRGMEDKFIKMIADYCPFLEELHLSGCQNIDDDGMKYLASGRAWKEQRVKVLDISGCYCIGDTGIQTLTPSALEKLDISDCSFITDSGLKYIFDGMSSLKEIGYENCSGTSSIGRDKLQSRYQIFTKTE